MKPTVTYFPNLNDKDLKFYQDFTLRQLSELRVFNINSKNYPSISLFFQIKNVIYDYLLQMVLLFRD
jgi:hypothetical protein